MRIVAIVDDDEFIGKSLGRLLRSAAFHFETFASAEAFLEFLPDGQPDCLILDIQLPGLSGIELYRRLSDHDEGLPTIFISAHKDQLTRARKEAPGEAGYLLKPFDSDELIAAVQSALNGNQSPEETPT
jgi:FixJ family two-component response regulator